MSGASCGARCPSCGGTGQSERSEPGEVDRACEQLEVGNDLIACWTLVEADLLLVANKSGPTRLGSALMRIVAINAATGTVTELNPASSRDIVFDTDAAGTANDQYEPTRWSAPCGSPPATTASASNWR